MSVKKITREAVHIRNFLSTAPHAYQQPTNSDKLNEQIVSEFRRCSKPIKLISRQKSVWSSAVVHYDSDYLYVRIPTGFELKIGAALLINFLSKEGHYVIQTLIHKITPPILCLKLQDPRRDIRYQPLSFTTLDYVEVNHQTPWLLEKDAHIIRLAEEEAQNSRTLSIKDVIGIPEADDQDGKPNFTLHQNHIDNLEGSYHQAGLHDFSLGGVSVNLENADFNKHSLLHIRLNLENENHSVTEIELSLFGIVCSLFPLNEKNFRCGINFINRIDHKSFHDFLQKMNAS
jgi:hypothetical protein